MGRLSAGLLARRSRAAWFMGPLQVSHFTDRTHFNHPPSPAGCRSSFLASITPGPSRPITSRITNGIKQCGHSNNRNKGHRLIYHFSSFPGMGPVMHRVACEDGRGPPHAPIIAIREFLSISLLTPGGPMHRMPACDQCVSRAARTRIRKPASPTGLPHYFPRDARKGH